MEKLVTFLFKRSKVSSMLLHAIHDDYDTYLKFVRRSKLTSYDIHAVLHLAGIHVSDCITSVNMYDQNVKDKLVRDLFVRMKKDKEEILKNLRSKYDCTKITED